MRRNVGELDAMFARICLAMIAMHPWSAVSCLAAARELGVYIRSDGGASAPVIDALKREVERVLGHAGYRAVWWVGNAAGPFEAEELIVVDLRGSCNVPKRTASPIRPINQLELASTFVADSQILPFSSLDCSTFNGLLSASLARLDKTEREPAYGRALARVLAHEFYHVLVRTHKHTAKGVAKKAHSAEDLLADRFDFDSVALGQLRLSHPGGAIAAKNQTGPESAISLSRSETPAEPVVPTVAIETPNVRQ